MTNNIVRSHQNHGNFTPLEISEKEFHDTSVALLKKQLELIDEQKKYGRIIRNATIWMASATVVMALAMIVQCCIMLMRK
jgi:hypothetical protein